MPVDGRVVIGVLATPFIYGGLKSPYWSNQLKKLNDREVMSERYVPAIDHFLSLHFIDSRGCISVCLMMRSRRSSSRSMRRLSLWLSVSRTCQFR